MEKIRALMWSLDLHILSNVVLHLKCNNNHKRSYIYPRK